MEKEKRKIKIRYLVGALVLLVVMAWYSNSSKKGPSPFESWIDNGINSINDLFDQEKEADNDLPSPNDLKTLQLLSDRTSCENQAELATHIKKLEIQAVNYRRNNKEKGSLEGLESICDEIFKFKVKKEKLKGYYYDDLDMEYKVPIMNSIDNIQAMYKDFDIQLITDSDVYWGTVKYIGADFVHIKK